MEKTVKQVYFKIDGEFITDLARTWFWDERKDYSVCEELLLNCLITDMLTLDERKQIAQQIIEGRKKLVGINELDLIDDNENVRPIYQMINQLQKEAMIRRIEDDIQVNAINYVDTYSTVISYRVALEKHISSYDEVVDWFRTSENYFGLKTDNILPNYYEQETQVGLWLLERPKLIYDLMGQPLNLYNRDKFFEKLYNYIGEENLSKEMQQRQDRYKATMRIAKEKKERQQNLFKEAEESGREKVKEIRDKLYHSDMKITLEDIDNMSVDEYAEYIRFSNGYSSYVKPDDIIKFEGLIDKKGNFYSCDFGGHNAKAYYIMCTYYKDFGFESRRTGENRVRIDNALDDIIKAGWIATRYDPSKGNYLEIGDTIRPTKAQKERVWDAMVKHEITAVWGLEKLD